MRATWGGGGLRCVRCGGGSRSGRERLVVDQDLRDLNRFVVCVCVCCMVVCWIAFGYIFPAFLVVVIWVVSVVSVACK